MTANEMYKIFQHFISNDFKHLRSRVDWLFYTIVGGLITIVTILLIK